MTNSCRVCQAPFEIAQDDLAFYDKVSPVISGKKYSLPPPTRCPDCRRQRRLSFRNERKLYKRRCDLSGKPIISHLSPDKPFKAYQNTDFWSDKWNPLNYGREFDFSRPFFDQFAELMREVPQLALCTSPDIDENNCPYVNYAGMNKNSHMIFDSDSNEDSYYSNVLKHSKHCVDCSYVDLSELCYECVDCSSCYNLFYSQDCTNCHDSYFLKNCIGCSDCILCCNLTRKQYCIENKQLTKEEYEEALRQYDFESRLKVEEHRRRFREYIREFPQKYSHVLRIENCTGDYIHSSKNCADCFNISDGEDLKYCDSLYHRAKDCMDVSSFGENIEQVYESGTIGLNCFHILFCTIAVEACNEQIYCLNCRHSSYSFGSISLKHNKYCLLNKQYSEKDYYELLPKVIEHMRETGEWGEYFPPSLSLYAYNETIAQDYYPLTKEVALSLGYGWKEEDPKEYQKQSFSLPETIKELADASIGQMLACDLCEKNYKLNTQELKFYRKQSAPPPTHCPDCRHARRFSQRNGLHLWKGKCQECEEGFQTTYSPQQNTPTYCESCFQQILA